MLRDEFEQMTGFWPTNDEWKEIEAAYGGSDLDKHDFCRNFVEGGQVDRLISARGRRIAELEREIEEIRNTVRERERLLARCYHHLPRYNPYISLIADKLGLDTIREITGR